MYFLLFHPPGLIAPRLYDALTQHIDIKPTLLGLLDYREPYFAYGRHILDTCGTCR